MINVIPLLYAFDTWHHYLSLSVATNTFGCRQL